MWVSFSPWVPYPVDHCPQDLVPIGINTDHGRSYIWGRGTIAIGHLAVVTDPDEGHPFPSRVVKNNPGNRELKEIFRESSVGKSII